MEKLKLMIIDYLAKDDPKRLVRLIIKRHLPDMHIASNPIRKSKRSTGAAII